MKSAFIFLVLIIIMLSCNKSGSKIDKGCGCNTDSVVNVLVNSQGVLQFDEVRNVWRISVPFPAPDNSYECKVCNSNIASIRAITDTLMPKNQVSITFSGKLKRMSPDEPIFSSIPEKLSFDLTIDSLRKN